MGTLRPSYCALLVGCSSVPTLASTASRFCSNIGTSGARNGCTANVRWLALVPGGTACGVRGTIGRTPPHMLGLFLRVPGGTVIGAAPTGIRLIGSCPVLRALV